MRRGTMLLTLLLAGALLAGCGRYCVAEHAPADPVYDPVTARQLAIVAPWRKERHPTAGMGGMAGSW